MNLSAPAEQGLNLNRGEILQASVQSIKDGGLLTLLVKGRLIEAVTQVPVNTGQELFLQVDGVKNGQVFLKVLSPIEMQQVQSNNLAMNLIDMGIQPSADTLLAARILLANKLAVNPENINLVRTGAAALGGMQQENIQAAALALSRGISLDKPNLDALKQMLASESNLARTLESLLQSLDNAIKGQSREAAQYRIHASGPEMEMPAARMGDKSSMSPVAKSASDQSGLQFGGRMAASMEAGKVPESGINAGRGAAIPAGISPNLTSIPNGQAAVPRGGEMTSVTTPAETVMAAATGGATNPGGDMVSVFAAHQLPGSINTAIPGNRPPISIQQLVVLKELLETLLIRAEGGSKEIAQKVEQQVQSVRELVRGIILAEEIVKGETGNQSRILPEDFLTRLETLERELSGPRIINYSNRGWSESPSSAYYFSFPVVVDQQTHLCELRFNKDAGHKSLKEQENIQIAISLETGRLGLVLFHINWHKKGILTLQGVVEKAGVKSYLETGMGNLVKELERMGYQVHNQGLKLAESAGEKVSLKNIEMSRSRVNALAIDIIV
jgi:hypothetical protein